MTASSPLDRDALESALGDFDPISVVDEGRRAASVVIAVLGDGVGGRAIPLTMRPATMRNHPGQFALPGGSVDPGESGLEAAVRELEEELGITAQTHDVLGRLDDYVTRSGFVITPFVVWSEGSIDSIVGSPDEVETVFAVSAEELDVPPRFVEIPESTKPVIQWPFRGHLIHAPTGAVIHQFCELALHGRHTRVDGFDQPVFAWR